MVVVIRIRKNSTTTFKTTNFLLKVFPCTIAYNTPINILSYASCSLERNFVSDEKLNVLAEVTLFFPIVAVQQAANSTPTSTVVVVQK